MKTIYLVGFMGTGKTSVGKALAAQKGLSFVDLDTRIEIREKRPIKTIFSQEGEAYFRAIERAALEDVAIQQDQVVSCGGGIVLAPENIRTMKQHGVMICLAASVDCILKRTGTSADRPLLQVAAPRAQIEKMLAQRQPLYAQADYTVDTTRLSIPAIVAQIDAFLKTLSTAS
ncbi:MAG TPA: shikimate kinase [Candidatus Omnitrophota bacterium]|nr:shikimate kinase [Candidatus Omnitrophota bacterium]HRZ14614.1 shikimate kinase [Candidatus Omnitrophota bacterium]